MIDLEYKIEIVRCIDRAINVENVEFQCTENNEYGPVT
jgi:hypothetical protein